MLFRLVLLLCGSELCKASIFDKLFWDQKIVGGKNAAAVPYQISLQIGIANKTYHFCGGVILNEHVILTAAHCVANKNASQLSVLAGTSDLKNETNASRHSIASCVIHPDFRPLNTSDIALCKVQVPFVFGATINKASISRDYVGGGVNCTLTGFGSTSIFREFPFLTILLYPSKLQESTFLTLTNDECSKKTSVNQTQICTQTKFLQRGACAGDSGGPLVCNGALVGLVSYGTQICALSRPDVYTRVSFFYDWIMLSQGLDLIPGSLISSAISSLPSALQDFLQVSN